MTLDSALTVSRYETTGSDFLRGMQAWSSSRSFRQISKWSSPERGNNHVHFILQFTLYYSQMENTTTHTHTHTHTHTNVHVLTDSSSSLLAATSPLPTQTHLLQPQCALHSPRSCTAPLGRTWQDALGLPPTLASQLGSWPPQLPALPGTH